jgi:hypothetical protein
MKPYWTCCITAFLDDWTTGIHLRSRPMLAQTLDTNLRQIAPFG